MITLDLSKLGYREMDMAGDLLKAHAEKPAEFLGDEVRLCYNEYSDNIFLTDE